MILQISRDENSEWIEIDRIKVVGGVCTFWDIGGSKASFRLSEYDFVGILFSSGLTRVLYSEDEVSAHA